MSVPEPRIDDLGTQENAAGAPHREPAGRLQLAPPAARLPLEAWLELVCRMVPNVKAAAVGFDLNGSEAFESSASWPQNEPTPAPLFDAAIHAVQRAEGTVRETAAGFDGEILARRMVLDGGRSGAVALALPAHADAAASALLQVLEWSAAWLELVSTTTSPGSAGTGDAQGELMHAGLAARDRSEAATAMAAVVAAALDADRVAVGRVVADQVELLALSHSASFNPRLQLGRDIVAAMEEALDEGHPVIYPVTTDAVPTATHAHERLCAGESPGAACSVALVDAAEPYGALTVERDAGAPFGAAELERLLAYADAMTRVLAAREASERSLLQHTSDRLRSAGGALRVPGATKSRISALLAALAAAVLLIGKGDLQVAAPAVLEGKVHRSLTSPIDGYVAAAPVRAGDALKAGEVVARIDTRSLEFERRRWSSERSEFEKSHRQAIAKLDRAEASIMKARLGRANSQLHLIEEQLRRATITAPFDGMLISGDLSRSMGAPVSRGDVLFEIAPLDDYRVELNVDERDIATVKVGQRGHLALTALPTERLGFTVEQITSVAQLEDGRNVFKVEAALDDGARLLRPGMRGIGKITAGERRLWRVFTHGLIDRVRLWLWSRAP